MTAVVIGLALVVAVLAVLVAGVLRSHAEILKSLHELGAGLELDRSSPGPVPVTIDGVVPPRAAGAEAPEALIGETLDGEQVALPLRGGATLLAFLSSSCTTCQEFWTAFRRGTPMVPAGARLAVVVRDLTEESPGKLRDQAPQDLPVVSSSALWDALDIPGSPYFVLVDPAGRIVGEGSGASWPQVADLLGQAHEDDRLRRAGNGAHREARDEAQLRAAGVEAGHPSLHEAL
jgi:hypothetical protein